jgi:hypothetical protein
MKLLRVLGSVVAIVAVAGGGYVGFEVLRQPPAAFTDEPVAITSNCKADDVKISAEAGDQVAWTVQGNDVVVAFQVSPFVNGKNFPVGVLTTATQSGPLTKGAKACAVLADIVGLTCDYPYMITRKNANCDPKVIVSK